MLRRMHMVGGYVAAVLALIVFAWLRQRGLLAATPYWVLVLFLAIACVGDAIGRLLQRTWPESVKADRVRIATSAASTALVLYATGWGSMLTVGFAVGATQILGQSARRDWRWAYGCNVVAIALGEVAVHLGVAPTLIDEPLAHAVAAVGVICLAFVLWILGEALQSADVNRRLVRERERSLIRQANTDLLTGLPNRASLNDRLEHAMSRLGRVGGSVAVLVVDLDGFKNVNDSLGHRAGDDLLVAVADRFRMCLRSVDTIARVGGDEFAVLVEDVGSREEAGWVAQRVLNGLVDPLWFSGRTAAIGASVGIALTDRADTDPGQLLSQADVAMYRAKRSGRGCSRFFEPAMHTDAVERMDLEQDLRAAIADDALAVHYQPVVDARTGAVTSFEALARWHHPDKGDISPRVFIPLAEQAGLILDLGRSVLEKACRQVQAWRTAYPDRPLRVAVNASRIQLAHPSFAGDVASALTRAEVAANALIVEVTESVLAHDSERVIQNLDELRRAGVRVAIDDFGTGYSSLSALASLPIDILKIDKQFVDKVAHNGEGRGFVNAIMQLAQTLDLETVAEGVEQPEQLHALDHLGCTHIQGFLHSHPLPAEHASEYLDDRDASSVALSVPTA